MVYSTLLTALPHPYVTICSSCALSCVNRRARQVSTTAESWVSVGFSSDGEMVGSDAVIGLPDDSDVSEYSLMAKVRALLGCNLLVVLGVVVAVVVVVSGGAGVVGGGGGSVGGGSVGVVGR